MSIDGWRERLASAIANTGRSERDISLSAKPIDARKPKLNPGYVHSILKEGKEPTVGNLQAICEAVGVSIYYVLGGFDITPERERFLRALVDADPRDVETVIRLIGAAPKRAKTPEPPVE